MIALGLPNLEALADAAATKPEKAKPKLVEEIERLCIILESWPNSKRCDSLFGAISEKNITAIRELLARGVDPNEAVSGSRGFSVHWPLGRAIETNSLEIVELLLTAGAEPNVPPPKKAKSYSRPLATAARGGYPDIVRRVIAAGADVRADGGHALVAAATMGHLEVVRILIDAGADPKRNEIYKNTGKPIDIAKRRGFNSIVDHLRGKPVKFRTDEEVRRNLEQKEVDKSANVMEFIGSASEFFESINPELKQENQQRRAAMASVEAQYTRDRNLARICELIRSPEFRIHLDELRNGQSSLLARACEHGWESVVDALLDVGVMPDDDAGPVLQAAANGHTRILEKLLSLRVIVDGRDHHGRTALFLAVEGGHLACVKMLLAAGAEPTLKTKHGARPMYRGSDADQIRKLIQEARKPARKNARASRSTQQRATKTHVT